MHAESIPWYRIPMVWLVFGLPAAVIPAGLVSLVLAVHGSDPVVRDDFRVDGLAINHDPVRDAAARTLDVHASLLFAPHEVTVVLREGRAQEPGKLVLLLSHATLATEDRELRLAQSGPHRYSADLGPLPTGHWYIELAPPDRAWRLTGELAGAQNRLELEPRTAP